MIAALCAVPAVTAFMTGAALAVAIELRDVAPDRIERQRAAAAGKLPLPGTPDVSRTQERLAELGVKPGVPVFVRIFKANSELELWVQKNGAYVHFATYPICHWSGTLGPKLREGDKQTPEGFYTITSRQLHRLGRWQKALNLGFPNAYDEALQRDGSYILVHGGCSSVGCFAMTNPVITEVYGLVAAALRGAQRHVAVHVFPFRMTGENLASHKDSQWAGFWSNLKEGYDSFERTRQPPRVSVCEDRYNVRDVSLPAEAGDDLPLAVCGQTAAAIRASDKSAWIVPLKPEAQSAPNSRQADPNNPPSLQPSNSTAPTKPPQEQLPEQSSQVRSTQLAPQLAPLTMMHASNRREPQVQPILASVEYDPGQSVDTVSPDQEYELVPKLVAVSASTRQARTRRDVPCSLARASCRKYAALQDRRERRGTGLSSRNR